jgi:hypothetical protein
MAQTIGGCNYGSVSLPIAHTAPGTWLLTSAQIVS